MTGHHRSSWPMATLMNVRCTLVQNKLNGVVKLMHPTVMIQLLFFANADKEWPKRERLFYVITAHLHQATIYHANRVQISNGSKTAKWLRSGSQITFWKTQRGFGQWVSIATHGGPIPHANARLALDWLTSEVMGAAHHVRWMNYGPRCRGSQFEVHGENCRRVGEKAVISDHAVPNRFRGVPKTTGRSRNETVCGDKVSRRHGFRWRCRWRGQGWRWRRGRIGKHIAHRMLKIGRRALYCCVSSMGFKNKADWPTAKRVWFAWGRFGRQFLTARESSSKAVRPFVIFPKEKQPRWLEIDMATKIWFAR